MGILRILGVRFDGVGPLELEIAAGECVALSGPSGAGKTRLLRAIVDLDPHQGEVCLGPIACSDLPAPEWRRRVGLLPPEPRWWHDTVGEHLARRGGVPELMQALGFGPEAASWEVSRLSSGETQRLALLRLLTNDPQALLLDEPTAHLDKRWVHEVEALIGAYRARHGLPVLWVTHDPQQAERVAERRLVIADGRLTAVG